MSRLKKPFSELLGVSPGDFSSPGVYRFAVLIKALLIILFALSILCLFDIPVDAATVSGNDSAVVPQVTEVPATPEPTPSPVPTPSYMIENEVYLDGANLYGDAANVVLYAQEVVLASETEGETNTSTFPEKSGYFVVPVSDTKCAYVPEGFDYWIVYSNGYSVYSCVSNEKIYLHGTALALDSLCDTYRYNADGSLNASFSFDSSVVCEHGRFTATSWGALAIATPIAGNFVLCADEIVDILESISLTLESLGFASLQSQSLTAIVAPEDFSGTLTWTSTDESVARYSGGLVIPVSDGECQIIASYVNPDGTVVSASCDVTVSLPVEDKEPTELEAFLQEPVEVDRYQYEILKRLEFMQYAQALMIALIFILIFKRK